MWEKNCFLWEFFSNIRWVVILHKSVRLLHAVMSDKKYEKIIASHVSYSSNIFAQFCYSRFSLCFYASSFCLDNIFFDLDKKFCPKLKNCYFLGKRIENGFLVVEKKLSIAKKSFSIHFTSKYVLCFSLGQKPFCLREKIFYPGQK